MWIEKVCSRKTKLWIILTPSGERGMPDLFTNLCFDLTVLNLTRLSYCWFQIWLDGCTALNGHINRFGHLYNCIHLSQGTCILYSFIHPFSRAFIHPFYTRAFIHPFKHVHLFILFHTCIYSSFYTLAFLHPFTRVHLFILFHVHPSIILHTCINSSFYTLAFFHPFTRVHLFILFHVNSFILLHTCIYSFTHV